MKDKRKSATIRVLLFCMAVCLCLAGFKAPAAEAFILNVVDQDGNPVNGFRWLLEEDNTNQPPTPLGQHVADTLSVNIHKSYAPVLANGSSTSSSTIISFPDTTPYFVSVLPSVSVPFGFTMSGARVEVGQGSVTVTVNRNPIPTAQVSVLVFEDTQPINNAPDPAEVGLANFSILIFDQLGQMSQDAFGNPLGTEYQFTTDAGGNRVPVLDANGDPVVQTMGSGVILTDANGEASIKYLNPGKYGIRAIPPTGSGWIQTNTIEGTPGIDVWVKAGEPRLLLEFGPPFPHTFFGFVKPMDLLNTIPVPPGGSTGTITGRVVRTHQSRPPLQLLNSGNPVPECYIGLNVLGAGTNASVYVAACNPDSTFQINNVPPGTYQVVMWDKPLDMIFAFQTATVPDTGGTVAMGDIPVNMWFGTFEGTVFKDADQDGFWDPGETGIDNQAVNLRFRDGSIYQQTVTVGDGSYSFEEVFPFFKWIIAEVDYARYRATGATIVVDNGGPLSPLPIYPYDMVNTPQPQPENGNLGWRTETAPEPVLLEAMTLYADQTNIINWGKTDYPAGMNGGIAGIVYYAVTRAENDPRISAAEIWEPGVPGVTINLYEDFDGNGVPDGAAIDSVTTDSWDASLPTGCVGPTQSVYGTPIIDCAETLRTWNQVRPGLFDGGYIFTWPTVQSGMTYIVEAVPPTGFEIVKEENKNVDFGERYYPSPLLLAPPCVGNPHTVPPYLTLFTDQQIPAPFAGQLRPLCDRKQVLVSAGQNAVADFHVFTEVPKSARAVGLATNDLAITIDPANPVFTEKTAPSWIPISFQDFTGREIERVYTDEWGAYTALLPSTFTINPPIPTGVSPNIITVCLNARTMANGSMDPYFDPRLSQTCYNLDFWPGKTTYLDTPIIPTAAFTGESNTTLDCEFSDGTPEISRADGPSGGPYVSVADGSEVLTITSSGTVTVPNPNFDPFVPGSSPTVDRDFGFGTVEGTVQIGNFTVDPGDVTWTAGSIDVTVQSGASAGGQVLITRGDNGKTTEVGVMLHVGNGGNPVVHVTAPGSPDAHPIQDAVDAATPGTLVLVEPGAYNENVIMYKNVKLQGYGAASTVINASPFPVSKITAWRAKLNQILGSVDLVPGQDPTFTNEEGPGIMVITQNAAFGSNPNPLIDGFTITGSNLGGAVFVNGYAHYLEISNNVMINNQGSSAGGIRIGTRSLPAGNGYQSSFNDHVSIHHNRIAENGTGGFVGAGGISVYNGSDFYSITDNFICGNFTTENGAGIAHYGLSDQGVIARNKIMFNESSFASATGGNAGGILISGEAAPAGAAVNLTPGTGSVTINGNLIQGNLAGSGMGGGVFAYFVNGLDVANAPNNSAGWYSVDMFNNMIVNNVAGLAGAGVALQDAAKVNIANNTVASNDSTATGIAAFAGGVVQSVPQGAGIVSTVHSTGLQTAIGTGGGPEFSSFANPVLYNNILWHNRSFYYDANQTGNGLGGLVPNTGGPYLDLDVYGSDTLFLNPQYCLLTNAAGYAGTNLGGAGNDPAFITPYFNQLLAVAAPGEGGNFIAMVFKPLTMTGNYHIPTGSPAVNQGFSIASAPLSGFAELTSDFDGDNRPGGGGVDIGADEATAIGTTYTITVVQGANGTITPGTVAVVQGGSQTFVITPDPGFAVQDVLVDGGSVGAVTLYTFNNVQANHNITASFTASTFTITATAITVGGGSGGSIAPSGAVVVNSGADQAFTVTPNTGTGYHTVDVLIDGGSIGPVSSYTFMGVSGDHTIDAIFSNAITLVVAKPDANTGTGTVTSDVAGIICGPDCVEMYTFGTPVTLTAVADPGSVFTGWSGGGCSGTGTCMVTMNADTTVTAAFSQAPIVPDKLGVFRAGMWYLDSGGNGAFNGCGPDTCYSFGLSTDKPVAGDWNSGGADKIGVFRNGLSWYLELGGNGLWTGCGSDLCYAFGGLLSDTPLAGDWNNSGTAKIGIFNSREWFLDVDGNGIWNPAADIHYVFGASTDIPVTGDWSGSGTTKIGVFRGGKWFLDYNGNGIWEGCVTDRCYSFGASTDMPVAGDWNGSGITRIGVFRNGMWYIDMNGNGAFNGCGPDGCYKLGTTGDKPVVGKW